MFSSVFLFIILLAFKHTHLISDLDMFPCTIAQGANWQRSSA